MSKLKPPHMVRHLMTKGCMGEFASGTSAFNPDESVALVRYFARLAAERTPDANDQLVEIYRAIGDASMARHKPPQKIACSKGCGSCCYQQVSVNAVEVFYIARRLRRTKAIGEHLARIATKLASGPRDSSRVNDPANPCAFLVDEVCSVHVDRPFACRAMVSLDLSACLRRFENGTGLIPYPVANEPIKQWLNVSLWTALRVNGFPPHTYELTAAIDAVLRDPTIERDWFAGEDRMAEAIDDRVPDHFPPSDALRAMARI